ncbi:MAG TPA: ABC transporter ATP-binding protein [bacterium]|nr:ABC transporter ATP-binding protein [bacterium]
MTIVALDSISLRRDQRTILDNVSWSIEKGQHWAVLGANGSGKTSLLKVTIGDEWPTEGTVEVLGERFGACSLHDLRKKVGWVSSALEHKIHGWDTALDITLSGFEASLGLYREFTDEELGLAMHSLSLVRAADYADAEYGKLSQGEQQRVLIARALVNRPALMILDEPCAGLDPVARAVFLGDLQKLAGRADSSAMVLVTHHIEEIDDWITHVLLLKAGRAIASAPKKDILGSAELLSDVFGAKCTVTRADGRYFLHVQNTH